MDLTKQELHVLQHSLGLTRGKAEYRNHFVTGSGSVDFPICEGLVEKGLMSKRRDPFNEMSEQFVYHVTEEGRQKAKEAPATYA